MTDLLYEHYAVGSIEEAVMNKSEILRALEWVDQAARDGDAARLIKAKSALEQELASPRNTAAPDLAYKSAFESFIRKHGREPMESAEQEE
jgi:hypothetical protein